MVGHHVCHGGYNAAMTEGNEIKGGFTEESLREGRGTEINTTGWIG